MDKPIGLDIEGLKTYDEWKKLGYGVIKGQHAYCRKNGKYYFNKNQVINISDFYKDEMVKENDKMIESLIND